MSESAKEESAKKLSDAERLELAQKLDDELDDFIQGLEKKTYAEGWPEDRWEEEMEKHPFFMKKLPEPGDELSPLMQGLQNLKYGVEDNTPEELAQNYKEDGNFNYKYKKFRLAILSYTEGIKTKCEDKQLLSQLYHNRAAANLMLKNYRSCLNDCKLALKLNPDYQKVWNKAITCALQIKDYDQCVELCDKYLSKWPKDKDVVKTRAQAISDKKRQMRDKRMQEALEKKVEQDEDKLISAIKSRNIKMVSLDGKPHWTVEDLQPRVPQLAQHRVHLDKDNKLSWPVIFCYPQTQEMDFVQEFQEDISMEVLIAEMFQGTSPWDSQGDSDLQNLNVYFEDSNKTAVYKVDLKKTLLEILQHKRFLVTAGTPSFIFLRSNSDAEKHFLSNYTVHKM